MKRKANLFIRLYKIKNLIKNFTILFVFLASFILILINKTENIFLEKSSSAATEIISPILDVLIFPAKMASKGYEEIIELKNNIKINKDLAGDRKELAALKNKVKALEIENNVLSNLLNYQKHPSETYITARVIAEEESPFSQSLIVYVGNNKNIKKGQVVVSNNYLVGRVESVGKFYAKILMATDINSNIPIILQNESVRGMLVGNNTKNPYLRFLPIDATIKVGEPIITSGVAGVFPAGIVVGRIASIEKNFIKVNLSANVNTLEYVQIVDYDIWRLKTKFILMQNFCLLL